MEPAGLEMKFGTIAYLHCDKGILMLNKFERKNDPNSGYHTLPGGKLELCEKGIYNSEGRKTSIIREVEDETGITLIKPILMGTILFYNKERTFDNWPDDKKKNFLVHMYYARNYTGELYNESDEGTPYWAQSFEEIKSKTSNQGDKLMYQWISEWETRLKLNEKYRENGSKASFLGVIKHNGKELDEEGSWVDWMGG